MKTTLLDHCSSSLALFNPSGCHTKIADTAESGIFKLKTRRLKNQPILLHVFLQSSGCSRCSAKTVSFDVFKGKTITTYLKVNILHWQIPLTLGGQVNWTEVLSELKASSKMGLRFSSYRNFFLRDKILKLAHVSFVENQMFTFLKNLQSEKEFKTTSFGVNVSNRTCFSYLHERCKD